MKTLFFFIFLASLFLSPLFCCVFFFNDTATTEIYTLSLHDALPISAAGATRSRRPPVTVTSTASPPWRSEEHTSELQSPYDLVSRLLLEKKKTKECWWENDRKTKADRVELID